ncbi:UPF0575 protein C19orf67 -like protein [Channa argus]|uniref:UPF0575 protein C19orf67-like protein n=1 Tax=Channa argus TaxID=215402 RepID=A0A6G1PBJ1_CHAAH|nr:UPF0575 protein C19orf67 -like protein [Channa argus]
MDDVALAPTGADHGGYTCLDIKGMEMSLQSMQLQLQFFMHKADDLHSCLVNGQGHVERDALAAAVVSFLYTCQPYFNHLESTVRSTRTQHTSLALNIYTQLLEQTFFYVKNICRGLLDIYQQLCDKLEQLVLSCASYNLLCLEETEPNSYFLCYEDIPNTHAETDWGRPGFSDGNVVRMWSIGQWVQVDPDPITETIDDWILCDVPQANYNKLLFLGIEEPSCCIATDYMQQLLLLWKSADSW